MINTKSAQHHISVNWKNKCVRKSAVTRSCLVFSGQEHRMRWVWNCVLLHQQKASYLPHSSGRLGESFSPSQTVVSLLQGRQSLLFLENKKMHSFLLAAASAHFGWNVILKWFLCTFWSICRVSVLSLASRSHSWVACRRSWLAWFSRADTLSYKRQQKVFFLCFKLWGLEIKAQRLSTM